MISIFSFGGGSVKAEYPQGTTADFILNQWSGAAGLQEKNDGLLFFHGRLKAGDYYLLESGQSEEEENNGTVCFYNLCLHY